MSSLPFDFKIEPAPGALIVSLHGDFDLSNSSTIKDQLEDVVARARHIIVDLSKVTFLDLSALRALEAAHRRAADRRHRVVLVGSIRPVRRLLEIAQVTSVIPTFESREQAFKFLKGIQDK